MNKGVFRKKADVFREIKVSFFIIIGFIVTIVNPIAWIAYLLMYKMGVTAGNERNTVKGVAQWFSFLIAIISYIGLAIYLIVVGA